MCAVWSVECVVSSVMLVGVWVCGVGVWCVEWVCVGVVCGVGVVVGFGVGVRC